jgi:4,5-DOPA dioxygenase extradiol
MFAIDVGSTGPALRQWAQSLATKPRAVLVMSPHWISRSPAVMTNPRPSTWHDFGGFPAPLYRLQYPAAGQPALAERVLALLQAAGVDAQADAERPFDHGTWVPLMHLWPDASIPVVQVALPLGATPVDVFAMGRAVRELRAEGVLVMGSGSLTHNLGEFFSGRPAIDAPVQPYVDAFARWVEQALTQHDDAALLDYAAQAPQALRAHPSDDHFLPLFFALGAASDAYTANYISREVMYGVLAMDAFALA